MSWVDILGGFFGPSRFKAITSEWAALAHEYRDRIAILEGKVEALSKENGEQAKEIAKLSQGEQECHKLILPLREQNILLKTENEFLRKLKP